MNAGLTEDELEAVTDLQDFILHNPTPNSATFSGPVLLWSRRPGARAMANKFRSFGYVPEAAELERHMDYEEPEGAVFSLSYYGTPSTASEFHAEIAEAGGTVACTLDHWPVDDWTLIRFGGADGVCWARLRRKYAGTNVEVRP